MMQGMKYAKDNDKAISFVADPRQLGQVMDGDLEPLKEPSETSSVRAEREVFEHEQ